MEQHRDEHIVCASCGASFLFSAGEAASFAEKGLVAPKRCKECRRARKELGPVGAGAGSLRAEPYRSPGRRDAHTHGGGRHRAHRHTGNASEYRSPMTMRYTGDVNEYRSPMTMRDYAPSRPVFSHDQGGGNAHHGQRSHGAQPWREEGNYRAPVHPNDRNGAGAHGRDRGAPPDARRRRPPAEMFDITCDACGANALVPFKPAEGRDVFCPTCYRARKPA